MNKNTKDKIAFVVVRYGKDINGGAELHCRMLAERLVDKYNVEVLTTCIKKYNQRINYYEEGVETINEVTVRRFNSSLYNNIRHRYHNRSKRWIKLRMRLFNTPLFKILARWSLFWDVAKNDEIRSTRGSIFYSENLFNYIQEHKDEYKAIICITLIHPTSYYTTLYAGEKTIIIPTLHQEKDSFMYMSHFYMTHVAYIAFNMQAEEKLGERIYGSSIAPHGIVGVSFEKSPEAPWNEVKQKYAIPDHYMLYMGRVDPSKMPRYFFNYFASYKKRHPKSDLKLVVAGRLYMEPVSHPDITYTGFVSDEEKTSLIVHSEMVVNPSLFESLSLILLEALSEKKPIIVNARCNIMAEHAAKSHGAVVLFDKEDEFIDKIHTLHISPKIRENLGESGKAYVDHDYDWNVIIKRLTDAIEYVKSLS